MEKSNRFAWDVTRLRPIPPLQFYHNINEKNICVTKRCEYIIGIYLFHIKYYYELFPFPFHKKVSCPSLFSLLLVVLMFSDNVVDYMTKFLLAEI